MGDYAGFSTSWSGKDYRRAVKEICRLFLVWIKMRQTIHIVNHNQKYQVIKVTTRQNFYDIL